MKKIQLISLHLRNFKGAHDVTVNFSNKTLIEGDNGTGKTTIFDAFAWLLYGKNSANESDFGIKTNDKEGNAIPKQEHEVEGFVDFNGTTVKLRRLYSEKWTKKRGNDTEEMTGHETAYFVDDVPVQKGEFERKISSMIDESISRMLTNPEYFCKVLPWKERRAILSSMAGEISDAEISEHSGRDLSNVIDILSRGISLEDEKKKIAAAKKISNDELKLIPSKESEVRRMIPESEDFEAIEKEIQEQNAKIFELDKSIEDVQSGIQKQQTEASNAIAQNANDKNRLTALIDALTDTNGLQAHNSTIQEVKHAVNAKNNEITFIESNTASIEIQIESIEKNEQVPLRAARAIIQNEQFVEASTCCQTCKREFEDGAERLELMRSNFNEQKTLKLKENTRVGMANAERINALKAKIEENNALKSVKESELAALEAKLHSINVPFVPVTLPETEEIKSLRSKIESFVVPQIVAPDFSEIKEQKLNIQDQIESLKERLRAKAEIEKLNARLAELNEQKRTLSQEIAELENKELEIEAYIGSKILLVEQRVNSKFVNVKFKMFEQQINGGENPVCVPMIDGVPYSDRSTAEKINAGLDVINGLQHHFQTFAPVFVDYAESVTQPFEIQSQQILLKVTKGKNKIEVLTLD